ncbi:hypothetical protein GGR88_001471 [Sphingomonas jejuensis]|uniref:Uncharacterized protein n=1 Tax=Sphingomonas jejuensis TaxID=904715 RepID=A0ABX0XMA4_9SPHN|nr:hypothetical protein [Sphingomonas jejuensis]NJC33997.1 hypothetical protein [Sphingomonas jejuensis]
MSEPVSPSAMCGTVILVGQDRAGHWLVQDSGRKLEGCFISRTAALSFAEAERQIYHARIEICAAPLVPVIALGALEPGDPSHHAGALS